MKFTALLIIALFVSTNLFSGHYKKYNDKTGKLVYTLSGSINGEYIYIWDDWGYKELLEQKTTTKVFGFKSEDHNFSLVQGKFTYNWKEGDDQITKMENPALSAFDDGKYNQKEIEKTAEEILKALKFEYQGKEMCEGKLCHKWIGESIGTTTWYWNTYSIKSNVKMMGIEYTMVVKEMNLGAAVDKSLLEIPKNKKIVEVDAQLKQQQNENSDEEGNEDISPEEAKELIKGLFGK